MDPTQPLGHDLEHTVAGGIGGLFGCGTSFVALLITLCISLALNVYLLRAFFTMFKDAVSTLKETAHGKSD